MKFFTAPPHHRFLQFKLLISRFCLIFILVLFTGVTQTEAQSRYGNTLNLGLGLGYYSYLGSSIPVFGLNYEFDVARNFTLAPFISFYSYSNYDRNNQLYRYRQTIIPIGVKGSLYLDELLKAGGNWDFYVAGSLGFSIIRTSWYDGYNGPSNYNQGARPLYLDLHFGTEYHINQRIGLFLDLSTGMSTVGLAFHR